MAKENDSGYPVIGLIKEAFQNLAFMCNSCAHNEVCKNLNSYSGTVCKDFLNSGNHKRYGNIQDLFQPIFDWLQFHHPHGDVIFIVDNTSAQMHLKHGVFALSKELRLPFSMPEATTENEKGE